MKKNKKGGFFSRSFLRKLINVILISALSITLWETGKKLIAYEKSKITYNAIEKEKNNAKNTQEFLINHNIDWITITNTAINYPLVQYTDNDYYMDHDYEGNDCIAGSIFYDAYDEPFNETCTVIYGHSMKDGTMFNNLHYFEEDHKRFEESRLCINTKDSIKIFKPLGYYETNNDFIYKEFDNLMTQDVVDLIEKKAEYFIKDTEVVQGAHIIALYTCDYSIKDGRLIVFYIEDIN